MTKLGELLGTMADKLAQDSLNIGDVHFLNLDSNNGITPKAGDTSRNKFFIILGFDNEGNVIGGLVINSNINYNLPTSVTDYQLPVTVEQFSFWSTTRLSTAQRLLWPREVNSIKILIVGLSPIQK